MAINVFKLPLDARHRGIFSVLMETTENFTPIMLHYDAAEGRIHFLLDYKGYRHDLLLQRSETSSKCEESEYLRKFATLVENGTYSEIWKRVKEFVKLFWPYVERDVAGRPRKGNIERSLKNRYTRIPMIRMQLETHDDGILHQVPHNIAYNYPLSDPIPNPCPSEISVFEKDNIGLLCEIKLGVSKLKACGIVRLLKVASQRILRTEIEILRRIPLHPGVISPLVGVVNAGDGKIDQLLVPWIEGRTLHKVQHATKNQKLTWKTQIQEAHSLLHEHGIAWIDGHVANIMIAKSSDHAVLVDFGSGCWKGPGGASDREFEEAVATDLKNLRRILERIDKI